MNTLTLHHLPLTCPDCGSNLESFSPGSPHAHGGYFEKATYACGAVYAYLPNISKTECKSLCRSTIECATIEIPVAVNIQHSGKLDRKTLELIADNLNFRAEMNETAYDHCTYKGLHKHLGLITAYRKWDSTIPPLSEIERSRK